MAPIFAKSTQHIMPGQGLAPVESTVDDIRLSSSDALTAHAGGGQANALLLTSVLNRVTTVATAADSVKLPPSQAGMEVFIINSAGANSMNVFPSSTETINAIAADGAFAMAAGARNHFVCPVAGKWFTFPLANS